MSLEGAKDTSLSANVATGLPFVEGSSASVQAVEGVISELAKSQVPVLLLAEMGAGKETTARRIHQMSKRWPHPFTALPCLQLTVTDLVTPVRNGAGTVYLSELAELSGECQASLLNALPEGGANGGGRGARLICGSAKDLELEVKSGQLREDLYYRISGVCLRLPPLRQRKQDIPDLMDYFLQKYAEDFHRPKPEISNGTLRLLQEHSWPGNLRELEDVAKVLVALGDESAAMVGLPAFQQKPEAGANGGRVSLKQASKAASREAEKELILSTLTRTQWNRRRAAKELQISYKALLYKLKQIRCAGFGA